MPYDPEAAYLSDNRHPQLPGQYTFLASSPSTTVLERRGPRTRTAQPVPVPNLTKKSRGRRVPTKTTAEKEREKEQEKAKEAGQKAGRVYVCKVEDCGKCFNRGEHLKRHVRSIHTHEKPFKCSYPNCDKFFNRHDNLLQHQKVHKDFANPSDDPDHRSSSQRLSPTSPAVHEEHLHVFRGAPPRPSDPLNMPYSTFPTYQSGPTSPMGFATNMAVSSLRTELPPSADGPQNGEARFYHAGPYEPESPLAQHRPFPAGPPLQMQPTEQHAVYP
ncbi:hypothetical protein PLICRDRAFT_99761 [Plicaturopsis crispa FD-325 SS-3]|nr:hypothetical protein PLICRDRAFT_99761 [Plicaturopsis crispa FD-325 SS-3]